METVVNILKVPMQTVNMETGELLKEEMTDWYVVPCGTEDGRCQECAVFHTPDQPHNPQSIYYQYVFLSKHGRFPTWMDAMEHCSTETKALWQAALKEKGITEWDEEAK